MAEGDAQALVLADEPATTGYLPEHRVFPRWLAADSEAGLRAAAETVLADLTTEREECGMWVSDGPAVLMDSAEAGADLVVEYSWGELPDQAPVPLPVGGPSTWRWTRTTGSAWSSSCPPTTEREPAPGPPTMTLRALCETTAVGRVIDTGLLHGAEAAEGHLVDAKGNAPRDSPDVSAVGGRATAGRGARSVGRERSVIRPLAPTRFRSAAPTTA